MRKKIQYWLFTFNLSVLLVFNEFFIILLVLAVMGGIGVVIYLKFIKKKPQSATTHDPDDYDYDDGVEIPDEEEIEIEDEETEGPDADGGGDEEREDQLE